MTNAPDEPTDVRMRGFSQRVPVRDAAAWIDANALQLDAEDQPLANCCGRVLSSGVVSSVNVPNFRRAMMDGYAVQAADTFGASSYNPLKLTSLGLILPGEEPQFSIGTGQCASIMTGAAMPSGADAVLPAEYARCEPALDQPRNTPAVVALGEVSPGKHVGLPGEDVKQGDTVAAAGRVLRPQDLGVLASAGVSQVSVRRQPRVRIVVTGNELLEPGSTPRGVKIADANSPMLTALIQRDGGLPIHRGLTPDDADSIAKAMQDDEADIVLVSGGSSVGQEDHAPLLLAKLGQLAIHGVAMRPSSPAGMGRIGERLVFLLPGNPVSCLCAYDVFAGRAIRAAGGLPRDWPYPKVQLPLARKLVSQIGRVDYARVQVANGRVEPLAISGASVLSSTTRADGFVMIDEDSEGFAEGEAVDVRLYDDTLVRATSPASAEEGR